MARFGDLLFGRYASFVKTGKASIDPARLAELGILWMLWRKRMERNRAEAKKRLRHETARVENPEESHLDDHSKRERDGGKTSPARDY